ncbi:hypothetical protein EXIGLDRAFT_690879 [Exidia glandulosa HHB12029]|uniref:Uncharacterized protein n=1 Tax=Exidia glandulosa HHB12029 TaxID=1314781 RepID=A0A165R022_EXIGL|nr:hypothetical protein EXIGLDRAFT_690879 [Exidia glandulosa HHB12029]
MSLPCFIPSNWDSPARQLTWKIGTATQSGPMESRATRRLQSLPLELLLEIFRQVVHSQPWQEKEDGPRRECAFHAFALASISHDWRLVVLNHALLWTRVYVDLLGYARDAQGYLLAVLARTKGCALDVVLCTDDQMHADFVDEPLHNLVQTLITRAYSVEVFPGGELLHFDSSFGGYEPDFRVPAGPVLFLHRPTPLLERLALRPRAHSSIPFEGILPDAPRLREVDIEDSPIQLLPEQALSKLVVLHLRQLDASQLPVVLKLVPRLEELSISMMWHAGPPSGSVDMCSLQRLHVPGMAALCAWPGDVLPALEELSIASVSAGNFDLTLLPSMPSLLRVCFLQSFFQQIMPDESMAIFFRRYDTVQCLEIVSGHTADLWQNVLHDPQILPCLHHIVTRSVDFGYDGRELEAFLGFITSRAQHKGRGIRRIEMTDTYFPRHLVPYLDATITQPVDSRDDTHTPSTTHVRPYSFRFAFTAFFAGLRGSGPSDPDLASLALLLVLWLFFGLLRHAAHVEHFAHAHQRPPVLATPDCRLAPLSWVVGDALGVLYCFNATSCLLKKSLVNSLFAHVAPAACADRSAESVQIIQPSTARCGMLAPSIKVRANNREVLLRLSIDELVWELAPASTPQHPSGIRPAFSLSDPALSFDLAPCCRIQPPRTFRSAQILRLTLWECPLAPRLHSPPSSFVRVLCPPRSRARYLTGMTSFSPPTPAFYAYPTVIAPSTVEEQLRKARWYKAAQTFTREYNHRLDIVLHDPPYESPFGPPPHDYNSGWGHLGDPLPGVAGGWYANRHELGGAEIDPAPDLSRNYNPPLPRYRPLRVNDLLDDVGSGWFTEDSPPPCAGWHTLAVANDISPPPPLAPLILDLSFTRIMSYNERMRAWEDYIDYCEMVDACTWRRAMLKLPTVACDRLVPCMRCRLHYGVVPGTRALYEPAAQRDLDWAIQERNEQRCRRNAVIAFREWLREPEPDAPERLWWPYGLPPRAPAPTLAAVQPEPGPGAEGEERLVEQLKRDIQELEQEIELLLKDGRRDALNAGGKREEEEPRIKTESDS